MELRQKVRKFIRDPAVVVDRLYDTARGEHPAVLRWDRDTDDGTLHALAQLAQREREVIRHESLHEAFAGVAETADAREMADLFSRYGSDKSTTHDYFVVYAGFLSGRRSDALSILEIGLGTNDPTVPSNMGVEGSPGASLRAFRDWAPQGRIFGADVDKKILFSEERIATYHVDQTSADSLAQLATELPCKKFDLIIDDGLHTPWANVNTLNFALPLLTSGGMFVVEDILDRYLPSWKIASALLDDKYLCRLIRCKEESVFLVRKRDRDSD